MNIGSGRKQMKTFVRILGIITGVIIARLITWAIFGTIPSIELIKLLLQESQ